MTSPRMMRDRLVHPSYVFIRDPFMPGQRVVSFGLVSCVVAAFMGSARAEDSYFKCVDERGNTTFTNTGGGKGCTKITVDPVVIPSPKLSTTKSPTPPGYPKVDSTTQKSRDSDRRRILEDELHDKEGQLARPQARLQQRRARASGQRAQLPTLHRAHRTAEVGHRAYRERYRIDPQRDQQGPVVRVVEVGTRHPARTTIATADRAFGGTPR